MCHFEEIHFSKSTKTIVSDFFVFNENSNFHTNIIFHQKLFLELRKRNFEGIEYHNERQGFGAEAPKPWRRLLPKSTQNKTKTNMGNNKKIIKISWECEVPKPQKSCSRVRSVYYYTTQLVSKRYSKSSKQIINMMLKLIPKKSKHPLTS